MICNHKPELYYWHTNGEHGYWFIKCRKCAKRGRLADTSNTAVIHWQNLPLLSDYGLPGAIFCQGITYHSDECEHFEHNTILCAIGWFSYCLSCKAQTPIVETKEKADILWDNGNYLKFDEKFMAEYCNLKKCMKIIKMQVNYIKSYWGLLRKNKMRDFRLVNDITSRIKIVYRACRGIGGLIDYNVRSALGYMIVTDVEIEKLESGVYRCTD